MSRIAYVNGQYTPHPYGAIHIEDRGYQFADGVYEVIYYANGHLVDAQDHLNRLKYSLAELQIIQPLSDKAMLHVVSEVIRRNRLRRGMVYIQISRGVAPRNHAFPEHSQSSLVITTRFFDQQKFMAEKNQGVKVISLPEVRWARPDIKSIALLPNVLCKQKAIEAKAYDALFINKDGFVTESSVANLWMLRTDGVLQTHPADQQILNGITRKRLIQIAQQEGFQVEESPLTLDELFRADEVFLSSSVAGIIPVIQVDHQLIQDGKPGKVVHQLSKAYQIYVERGEYVRQVA